MTAESFGTEPPTPEELNEEIGRHTSVFSAFPFMDEVASQLTPQRLTLIMDAARGGDIHALLTLAKDIEDRESLYSQLLLTRKLGVTELETRVIPPRETTPQTEAIMADMHRLTSTPNFSDMLLSLLDAINPSFAVNEIVWDMTRFPVLPVRYVEIDQRYFRLDRQTQTKLRFRDGTLDGEPLLPFKYLCHGPKYRFGPIWRSGLIRPVAALYMAKQLGLRDWMRFIELFGMPMRVATYKAGSTDQEKNELRRQLRSMGTEAFALFKEGSMIKMEEINRGGSGGSEDPFLRVLTYLNQQITILVQAQTLTTSESQRGTQALGTVHETVKKVLRNADAKRLAATVNRDLTKPFVLLNYGEQPEYPRFDFITKPVPGIEALGQHLPELVRMGLRIRKEDVHTAIGIEAAPDDIEDELILGVSSPTESPEASARELRQVIAS